MQTKLMCASSSNLADMLTMVNRIDFWGHSLKVKVTVGIIDKCGVHGDATLCVVIFIFGSISKSNFWPVFYLFFDLVILPYFNAKSMNFHAV